MEVHEPLEKIVLQRSSVSVYNIPVSSPESDGTIDWDKTTLIVVKIEAAGETGMGYTYAHHSAAVLIQETLFKRLEGLNVLNIPQLWLEMLQAVRNIGRPGIASMAIAAVDTALWDLKSKILQLPLVHLLGASRDKIAIYGSGGFTSYSMTQLVEQLTGWAEQGIRMVKMKIGTKPADDLYRVKEVVQHLRGRADLFVDANGAYTRKQATGFMRDFAMMGIKWFEEPVSSDDIAGLSFLAQHAPGEMQIAAGEYGFDLDYFRRMLEQDAVDVLQADATRCAGITGFMKAAVLAESFHKPFSSHCAPYLHLHPCCAAANFVHAEYFHDHVRIEQMLFDGAVPPVNGFLQPDLSRPGLGLEFKEKDAQKFKID